MYGVIPRLSPLASKMESAKDSKEPGLHIKTKEKQKIRTALNQNTNAENQKVVKTSWF